MSYRASLAAVLGNSLVLWAVIVGVAFLLAGCGGRQIVPTGTLDASGQPQYTYSESSGPNFGAMCGPLVFLMPPFIVACFK